MKCLSIDKFNGKVLKNEVWRAVLGFCKNDLPSVYKRVGIKSCPTARGIWYRYHLINLSLEVVLKKESYAQWYLLTTHSIIFEPFNTFSRSNIHE